MLQNFWIFFCNFQFFWLTILFYFFTKILSSIFLQLIQSQMFSAFLFTNKQTLAIIASAGAPSCEIPAEQQQEAHNDSWSNFPASEPTPQISFPIRLDERENQSLRPARQKPQTLTESRLLTPHHHPHSASSHVSMMTTMSWEIGHISAITHTNNNGRAIFTHEATVCEAEARVRWVGVSFLNPFFSRAALSLVNGPCHPIFVDFILLPLSAMWGLCMWLHYIILYHNQHYHSWLTTFFKGECLTLTLAEARTLARAPVGLPPKSMCGTHTPSYHKAPMVAQCVRARVYRSRTTREKERERERWNEPMSLWVHFSYIIRKKESLSLLGLIVVIIMMMI